MCPPDHLVPGQLINPGPWLCHCIQRKLGAAERAGTSGKCLLPRLFSLERGSKEKSLGRRHLPEVMCGDVKDCLVVYKKWGAKVSFFGSDPHLPTSHTCTFEVLLQPMEKVSHTSHLAQIKCNKVLKYKSTYYRKVGLLPMSRIIQGFVCTPRCLYAKQRKVVFFAFQVLTFLCKSWQILMVHVL